MLSDIHFDPFHDPAKFAQLKAAPASAWGAILNSAPSATQAADFDALQKTCKMKGVDTPAALFTSALHAMHEREPKPLFVTVSGDLTAHQFDCRFKQLDPKGTEAEYTAFAVKTVAYVSIALHATYPQSPIYFALGNNDSGCGDYAEDANSPYLAADAKTFSADVLSKPNATAYVKDFPKLGDANVALPPPFQHTRLLILQDLFESQRYAGCDKKPSAEPTKQQIAWLRAQLDAAGKAHEHVWVMAHIPPGVDAYNTFHDMKNVCGGDAPTMFLGSEDLARVITEYAGTVKLMLFGHTHMDEMRFYTGAHNRGIPGKLVPSITPVNGNNPSFTIAQADVPNAGLKDYAVYAADNQTGIGTKWSEEYRYSTTYHQPDFNAESLAHITEGFLQDKSSSTATSQAYQHNYFVGTPAAGMKAAAKAGALALVWPAYACSLTQPTEAGFRSCMCPAKP